MKKNKIVEHTNILGLKVKLLVPEVKPLSCLVMLSGGLDSVAVLLWYKVYRRYRNVEAVFFDYGQRSVDEELRAARYYTNLLKVKLHIVNLTSIANILSLASPNVGKKGFDEKELTDDYVPSRNLMFLGVMSSIAESRDLKTITTGFNDVSRYLKNGVLKLPKVYDLMAKRHASEEIDFIGHYDQNYIFSNRVQEVFNCNTEYIIKLVNPFGRWTKIGVAKKVASLFDEGARIFKRTWSCVGGIKDSENFNHRAPCGSCAACIVTMYTFLGAGLEDPHYYSDETIFNSLFGDEVSDDEIRAYRNK